MIVGIDPVEVDLRQVAVEVGPQDFAAGVEAVAAKAMLERLWNHGDLVVAGDLNSHYNQKQRYREMRTTGINDILGSQGNELAVRGTDRACCPRPASRRAARL